MFYSENFVSKQFHTTLITEALKHKNAYKSTYGTAQFKLEGLILIFAGVE